MWIIIFIEWLTNTFSKYFVGKLKSFERMLLNMCRIANKFIRKYFLSFGTLGINLHIRIQPIDEVWKKLIKWNSSHQLLMYRKLRYIHKFTVIEVYLMRNHTDVSILFNNRTYWTRELRFHDQFSGKICGY